MCPRAGKGAAVRAQTATTDRAATERGLVRTIATLFFFRANSISPEAEALDRSSPARRFVHVDQDRIHLNITGSHFKPGWLAIEKPPQDGGLVHPDHAVVRSRHP